MHLQARIPLCLFHEFLAMFLPAFTAEKQVEELTAFGVFTKAKKWQYLCIPIYFPVLFAECIGPSSFLMTLLKRRWQFWHSCIGRFSEKLN